MAEANEAAAKKKGKPIVLILAAVVLAGGGGAAFFMLKGGGEAPVAAPEAGAHGEPAAVAAAAGAVPLAGRLAGPTFELKPIIVNLNEPEGTRYLKTVIAVQLANDKALAEVERLQPVINDTFIRDLSELNFRQTMGNKNKVAIKRRLLKRFNEVMGGEIAVDIHLTEFIVQ